MSAPVTTSPRRKGVSRSASLAVPLALVVTAVAGGVAAATAPDQARTWVVTTVVVAWVCVAVAVVSCALVLRRVRAGAVAAEEETRAARSQLALSGAESAHLVNVALPTALRRIREGGGTVGTPPVIPPVMAPSDPQLRRVLDTFVVELADAEGRAARAVVERDGALGRLERGAGDLDLIVSKVLPDAIGGLRSGGSAESVLGGLAVPGEPRLASLVEVVVRELAVSERRAAAAQA
ncbi:ATP-binding protein, partial [Streptomyces sp. NPDC004749]